MQSQKTATIDNPALDNSTPAIFKKFNQNKQIWMPYQLSFPLLTSYVMRESIKILTLNVLTDCTMEAPLKRGILYSEERYSYILQQINKMNVDVITFNEVTEHFYVKICQQKWVQQSYWISEFHKKQSEGSDNLIMTKIQPISFRKFKINNLQRQILTAHFVAKMGKKQQFFSISCAHLTSLAKNTLRRKNQLKEFIQNLMRVQQNNKKIQTVHILQGDLNIHSEQQNHIFEELNLKDCWIEFHRNFNTDTKQILQENPGYTFDAQANNMIKQVYYGFEKRRMRLDRIVYSGEHIKCQKMFVVFNKSIHHSQHKQEYPEIGIFKGALSVLGDVAGYNIFRKKQQYLFPSDHFGLYAQITFCE